MLDIILDTLIDGLKLLPFLFFAFLLIELLEHKFSKKSKEIVGKSGKLGPLFGGLLGLFPQCGFSCVATNLYITRVITLGTLVSIYLSTSDEMLPILLSSNAPISLIIRILGIKLLVGILSGFIIDALITKKNNRINFDICDKEYCHCQDGILKSSIKHTIKTLVFILIVSFVLNIVFYYFGEEVLSKLFLKNSIFGPFISSLVGLIPNCGASIMITELYINNAISFGSMISGLLTGSGVALLILFKSNKDTKENIKILGLVYGIGVISGLIIELSMRI